jgi:uncharacterized protein (TIGR02001 family)
MLERGGLLPNSGASIVRKTLLSIALLSAFPATVIAQQAAPAAAQSPHTFTGNVALVSDYRFRGISQTWGKQAIQGGFDYAHTSGFYLGTWASNISGDQYYSGNMEWDLYGGYKWEVAKDLTLDIGAIYYYYPGAKARVPGIAPVTGVEKYDNFEGYIGASYQWFSAKYFHAFSDYFGTNNNTASNVGFCSVTGPGACDPAKTIIGAGSNRGGSKNSSYLDLGATFEVAEKTNLGFHIGIARVKNYGELNYNDYKASITKDWNGFVWGAAIVGADTKDNYYTASDIDGWVSGGARGTTKRLDKTTLVLPVQKTF